MEEASSFAAVPFAAPRGRYLPRHRARVIEQDNLFVVEFVDQKPWYTVAAAAAGERRRASAAAALPFGLLSVGASALTIARILQLI